MTQTTHLLDVQDLKTHFFTDDGLVPAVDGVSFSLERGKTLGILGESGCGKSVTGYSILNLVQPPGKIVGGRILYHQPERPLDLAALGPRSRTMQRVRGNEISMIFQEPMTSLDPLYTVGDQLMEAFLVHKGGTRQAARVRAVELVKRVGLPEPETLLERYPHQLSGGMRQRVVIAMALACDPQLLIADEPTTALDVTTEAQILELLKDLQSEYGMAILFVTHDLGVIAEMADEVIVMYLGKVVERAPVVELFDSPKHPYTQALMNSVPKLGGERRWQLDTIRGMVPSPRNIPSGCPFHPRCDAFMAGRCDVNMPTLKTVGESKHEVRCLLYEPEETV